MKENLIYYISPLLLFFVPIQGLLIAVGSGIFIDTMTGLFKAYKLKEKIESKKLKDTVFKFIIYQCSVLFIFLMDKYLLGEFFIKWFSVELFFTKTVCIFLLFVEIVSFKENIEEALKINIYDKLKDLLRKSKSIKDDIETL